MTEKQLNEAVELNEKRKFIKLAIRDLDENTCLFIGNQNRLDKYSDVHERLSKKMKEELINIHNELNKKIEKL